MPGLRPDGSPHATHRRFSESSDLPVTERLIKLYRSMGSSQVTALFAKTAKAAEAGEFELYKTSHHFDGTVANP